MHKRKKVSHIDVGALTGDEYMKLLESSSAEELALIVESFDNELEKTKPALPLDRLLDTGCEPRSNASVIAWWESRRILYNIVVGLSGIPMFIFMLIMSTHHFMFIVIGSICYGLLANCCYTLGWMAEIVARTVFGEKAQNIGPILFTLGTIFSVLVTLGFAFLYFVTVGF